MRTTPFKYLERAVNDKILEFRQLIAFKYGDGAVPKVKVFFTADKAMKLGLCKLHYNDEVINNFDTDGSDEHKNEVYQTYGVYHMTFNVFLINDLKLPFIHNIVGHEFAHACDRHANFMKSLVYEYQEKFVDSEYVMSDIHGPSFVKYCQLFRTDPSYYEDRSDANLYSESWQRANGTPYKLWCSCSNSRMHVDKASYDRFCNVLHICNKCKDAIRPYGDYVHRIELERASLPTI